METGIFFDLDGTLWDSADTVADSWNEVYKNNNLDIQITSDDLHRVMGMRMHKIAEAFMPDINEELRMNIMTQCELLENEHIRSKGGKLFDNVEKVLSELSKKYKLFIISNCQKGYIEAFLDYYSFNKYITDTENPGNTGLDKGDNITHVAKRNNIDNIIYVGDTNGDYVATCDAGGTFIFAAYGFGKVDDETLTISDFYELPALINKIVYQEPACE